MSRSERRCCQRCGALLRATNTAARCDPCRRASPPAAPSLPPDFYDRAVVVQALRRYDFGTFFKAVRRELALSQEAFGSVVGLEQSRICKVEGGTQGLRDVTTIARVARILHVPAARLGFTDEPAASVTDNSDQVVSWLDRRDFLTTVSSVALGMSAMPIHGRLAGVVPIARPEPLSRVGVADVERIEASTKAFRAWDYRWGGGSIRAAVTGQLDWVVDTGHRATCASEEVRGRLLVATADLASVAAWTSYDVERHDEARRLWMSALDAAQEAGNADLVCGILTQLAQQALHLDRPDEALGLLRLASATAADPAHEVSGLALAKISAYQGECYATAGQTGACDRALDQAEEHLGNGPTDEAPPWRGYWDRTQLQATRGRAYQLLARRQPAAAEHAEAFLTDAISTRRPEHARSKTLELIILSTTYFQRGEGLDDGIATGRQALAGAGTLNSRRSLTRLRQLDAATAPHARRPDVADFRHELGLVLAGGSVTQ